jgi:IstB-like ATP binding protein
LQDLLAIGQAAIQQGYRVWYRETHKLLDDLAEATIDGTRKEHMELLATVPLLIIDCAPQNDFPRACDNIVLNRAVRGWVWAERSWSEVNHDRVSLQSAQFANSDHRDASPSGKLLRPDKT